MKNLFTSFFLLAITLTQAQVQPIARGHAHNDYMHTRPLFEALESGFTSIEIDVFLHNNDLKVAHVGTGLDSKQNIEEEYLKPIQKIIKENGGVVYKGNTQPVIFMIDFKTGANETYAKLKEILNKYKDILAVYHYDSIIKPGPIHILISGSKPFEAVFKDDSSYATIDADMKLLEGTDKKAQEKQLVSTRYSDPWHSWFTWNGNGKMGDNEKAKLDSLVKAAHQKGKDIRFYGAPDKPAVWKLLLDAKVDWVNTDKLAEFSRFYKKR